MNENQAPGQSMRRAAAVGPALTGGEHLFTESSIVQASDVAHGTITLIRGCMFSGKTTELLRRLSECPEGSYALFKHEIDNRYAPDAVATHTGSRMPAVTVAHAHEVRDRVPAGCRVVAIDEGHFFDDALVAAVERMSEQGVAVLITALDRDSWAETFPQIDRLSEHADEDMILHATCARCGRQADRTQRLTPIRGGDMVGGAESYEPRCAACWTPPVVDTL